MVKYKVKSNIIKSIFLVAILSCALYACTPKSGTTSNSKNEYNEELVIDRFEQDLFKSKPSEIDSTMSFLSRKYASFFDVYFLQIMNFGASNSKNLNYIVADFIQNKDFLTLVNDCDSVYNEAEIKKLNKSITEVFEKYHEVYPKDTLPKVTTFVSGFTNGIVTTEGYIGIGLDLFLGENYRFYPSLDLPEYMIRRYTPNHLLPMFVKGMASFKYPFELEKPSLLDLMLNEGKMLYFNDQFLNNVDDTLKIGYTKKQMDWCNANEANIYQLLIQEGLFNTDYLKYRKYTDEAPFTISLTNESAPRIAWYCGWQIIKKFMDNNPDYTLDKLMKEKDSQKILSLSKYKP